MYQPTSLRFNPDQVAQLLHLAHALDPKPGPGGSGMTGYVDTQHKFQDTLGAYLPGRWVDARIVGLWPGQQIPAHVDAYLPATRHHIPLQLNSGCWVFSREQWQQLEEGQDYTMDPTVPHGAVNWGSEVRLHLMLDVETA